MGPTRSSHPRIQKTVRSRNRATENKDAYANNGTVTEILEAVENGGSAATFLGEAFVSFYRGGKNKIDLRGVDKLDEENFQLFAEMLTLRRRQGWSDDELFQVEQQVKRILGATA